MTDQKALMERYKLDVLADEAGGYVSMPTEEGMEYTDLFFSVCRQFGIRYNHATPKEKCFVEEVTRVTWELAQQEKTGIKKPIRPAFVA